MSIQEYRVSFPYGATTAPYTPTRPHRGNDRAAPAGTPVIIQGIRIGLVGATGWATGPTLHTQAGTDIACQKTINPGPYEFQPGTVVNTGRGDQWGNYVTIKVGDKYIAYTHLSRIDITKGSVIKALPTQPVIKGVNEMANAEQVKAIYRAVLYREGDPGGIQNYTGRDANKIISEMLNSPERKSLEANIANTRQQVQDMQNAINTLSVRPTKEDYARVQAQLGDSVAKLAESQKALEEAKKTGGFTSDDRKTLNAISSVVNAILTKITGVFK